jgi:hypothetical protein
MDGFLITKNYTELRRVRPDFDYIRHSGGHMISKKLALKIMHSIES